MDTDGPWVQNKLERSVWSRYAQVLGWAGGGKSLTKVNELGGLADEIINVDGTPVDGIDKVPRCGTCCIFLAGGVEDGIFPRLPEDAEDFRLWESVEAGYRVEDVVRSEV